MKCIFSQVIGFDQFGIHSHIADKIWSDAINPFLGSAKCIRIFWWQIQWLKWCYLDLCVAEIATVAFLNSMALTEYFNMCHLPSVSVKDRSKVGVSEFSGSSDSGREAKHWIGTAQTTMTVRHTDMLQWESSELCVQLTLQCPLVPPLFWWELWCGLWERELVFRSPRLYISCTTRHAMYQYIIMLYDN